MIEPELGAWEVVWDGPPNGSDHVVTAHCPNCGHNSQFRWRVNRKNEFHNEYPHMEIAGPCYECGTWFAINATTLFVFDRKLCEMSYEGGLAMWRSD